MVRQATYKRSLKRRELEIQRDAKMTDGVLGPIRAEQIRRHRRQSQQTGNNHRARRMIYKRMCCGGEGEGEEREKKKKGRGGEKARGKGKQRRRDTGLGSEAGAPEKGGHLVPTGHSAPGFPFLSPLSSNKDYGDG